MTLRACEPPPPRRRAARSGTCIAQSTSMRPAHALAFLLTTSIATFARAEEQAPRDVVGNANAHIGIGAGKLGVAGHMGGGGLAWMGHVFAVGAQGGLVEDDAILGDRSFAWYIGPTVAVRTSSAGTYGFFMGGAGIA